VENKYDLGEKKGWENRSGSHRSSRTDWGGGVKMVLLREKTYQGRGVGEPFSLLTEGQLAIGLRKLFIKKGGARAR